MILSCSQPRYLPWMGLFDKIAKADVHVWLDHVTLSKGDFVNRCQIMQRDGRPMWLTIPVKYGGPINETRYAGWKWRRKHVEALRQAYGVYLTHAGSDLLMDVIWPVPADLTPVEARDTPQVLSSSLGGSSLGAGSDLILNLCKEVGADTYLSGVNGKDYLDLPAFEKAGIEVQWHEYPVVQPVLSAVHDLFGKGRVAA